MKFKFFFSFIIVLFLSCNKDVTVGASPIGENINSSTSNTGSSSDASNTSSSSGASNTGSSSNETCSLDDEQSGTYYELRINDKEYFNVGDQITITMFSNIYSNGQVKNISLYKNDELIHSWGNWLILINNQRNLVLPSSLSSSSCYNVRVFEEGPSAGSMDDESYISELFEIRTN